MAEPYPPEFRRALKDAHPGLQDADIDLLQDLTTRRLRLRQEQQAAPGPETQRIENLDQQIEELIRTRVPDFHAVARRQAAARHAASASQARPAVEIRPKR